MEKSTKKSTISNNQDFPENTAQNTLAQNDNTVLVEMKDICKSFPGVLASRNINLSLMQGEVLALLGENGAGKSTLMNILCGLYREDSGEIYIRGEKATINSPRDASNYGIGMIHQNFMLVDNMTVAENIILGMQDLPFIPDLASIKKKISDLGSRYDMNVDPDAYIWQLSVGEQQRVEIVKQLFRNANILILDEPTAVLTPGESRDLASVIAKMKAEGKSAIFITHKMDEVMTFSDRVMVLRKGQVIAEKATKETDPKELARLMVGRELLTHFDKKPFSPGEVILNVAKVCAEDNRGLLALDNISFKLHSGEILGIAGVAGNGQRELSEVITGLRHVKSGSIIINSIDRTNQSPLEIIKSGVSHIPQDRMSVGSVGDMSVSNNLSMKEYRNPPISRGPILILKSIRNFAKNLIKLFSIDTPNSETSVKFLSGGNIQKTILAREISSCGSLLIAVYPSRGLDIGATESVRKELIKERDSGKAVLFISEDIDELISVADTISVIFDGKILGTMSSKDADSEKIGLLMAGVTEKESE